MSRFTLTERGGWGSRGIFCARGDFFARAVGAWNFAKRSQAVGRRREKQGWWTGMRTGSGPKLARASESWAARDAEISEILGEIGSSRLVSIGDLDLPEQIAPYLDGAIPSGYVNGMTIRVKPETERLVQEEIQSGHFQSVDDLIVLNPYILPSCNGPLNGSGPF